MDRAHEGARGKLARVGRAVAEQLTGRASDDTDVAEDCAALGFAAPAGWGLRDEPEAIAVWSTHWDALRVLLALSTQWDRMPVPGGGIWWRGLDYSRAEATMRMMRIDPYPIFDDLREMEMAALPILNGGPDAAPEEDDA